MAGCKIRGEDLWVPGALLLGLVVGLAVPLHDSGHDHTSAESGWRRVSALFGWSYFFAWSVSFWPQVVLNFQRQSVIGLSLDYQMLNFVGFTLYFMFNIALYCVPHVRQEYSKEHGGHTSAVQFNDVLFAGHAMLLTAATLLQIAVYYDYPALDRSDRLLRKVVVIFLTAIVVAALGLAAYILIFGEAAINWLAYLSVFAQVKVAISVCKYCPQVWMNYRRKSTEGWNIYNVLLDFLGGCLSVAQLLLDAWLDHSWSKVWGDPVKLLLGNISMVFDVIFMVQHYCLYRGARAVELQHEVCSAASVPGQGLLAGAEAADSTSLQPIATG